MSAIKLSVVIATFNRRHILERTLPALQAQDLPPEDYELIYAVDGSTDGTAEMLQGLKPMCALRVLNLPHRGQSAARNAGINVARGHLILFLDDDLIASPDLLRQHVAAHTGPDPVVVQGSLFLASGRRDSILGQAMETYYSEYHCRLNSQGGLNWKYGSLFVSNSSLPRDTLLACGGFDERFPAQEDYDLGLRLWKLGVRFQLQPDAKAYELYLKLPWHFLRYEGETYGRSEVMLCRKHPELRPLSKFASLDRTVWWKRVPRQLVLQSPVFPARMFMAPFWVCNRLRRFSSMQKAGLRLLNYGRRIVELRSAVREAGSWKALRSEFGTRLPVLLYRHVGPPRQGTSPQWTVSPQRFERQVRSLSSRGYKGICPSEWLRWLREGKGLPNKPVLFTFDDGSADLADYALPVLRRYGFGAGVFIVTGQVGGTNARDEARSSGTLRNLTCEQIRYWATQGIEFGAHSRTHTDLTTLSSHELSEEVVGSGKDLESILGSRVVSFSYPYGLHNQAVDDCVRTSFDLAFLGENAEGLNDLLTEPFHMRRTVVRPNDSWRDLASKVKWGRTISLVGRGKP